MLDVFGLQVYRRFVLNLLAGFAGAQDDPSFCDMKRQLTDRAEIRRNTSSSLEFHRPVFEIATDVTTVARNSDFAPKQ